jgi:methionyl-tRNA formyltransferase
MMGRLKTALLFQSGNFVGREYFARLTAAGLAPDLVIAAGRMKPESIAREIERTGGRWSPPPIPRETKIYEFERLSDPALWALVEEQEIELGIQGGVGILKPDMISVFRLGIVNVHPGKLPEYRGNACPEWALLNGDEIWATAHFVDTGIDTGPVILKLRYDLSGANDYFDVRAGLYAHCAATLIAALNHIQTAGFSRVADIAEAQDETKTRYWPAMDEEHVKKVRSWRSKHSA